jgi:uncharacterized protein (DUF1697 family)
MTAEPPPVPRYVAFLRGVNLGSTRQTKSEELKSSFEKVGFEDVATFRTSGNVIFRAGDEGDAEIVERIEAGLIDAFGFEIPVFLRGEVEVRAIAENEPFDSEVIASSKGKLQVLFLSAKPSASARKRALSLATDDDRLAIKGRELYWLPSGGTQRSALDQKALAELLGPATTRTQGTVQAIRAKFFPS